MKGMSLAGRPAREESTEGVAGFHDIARPAARQDRAAGDCAVHARTVTQASTVSRHLKALDATWSLTRTKGILLQENRWTWAGAQMLVADIPVDDRVARDWLPPVLALPDQPRATVFAAHYPDTAMGFAYREAGILLHARLRRRPVLHCAWMVVDDDTALILGRELLGFPKKLARIDFDFAPYRPEASVMRRGVELLRFEGLVDGDGSDGPVFPHPIVNTRGIPGALPNLMLSMQGNERCRSSNAMRLRLHTGDSPCDPVAALGIAGEHPARRVVVDIAGKHAGEKPSFPSPAAIVNPAWLWKAYPFRTW